MVLLLCYPLLLELNFPGNSSSSSCNVLQRQEFKLLTESIFATQRQFIVCKAACMCYHSVKMTDLNSESGLRIGHKGLIAIDKSERHTVIPDRVLADFVKHPCALLHGRIHPQNCVHTHLPEFAGVVELLRCHHWDFYCHWSHGRALMIFYLLWVGGPPESPILLHSGRQKKRGALLSFSRKAHNWYTIPPSTSSKKSPFSSALLSSCLTKSSKKRQHVRDMGVCGVSRTTTHLQLAWWQHKRLQLKKKTKISRNKEGSNYLSPLTFSWPSSWLVPWPTPPIETVRTQKSLGVTCKKEAISEWT